MRSLAARRRQSETEMAELRQELSRAEEDKDEIEGLLEARSTELADSALRQQEALESLEGKDAQRETLQARLEQAAAASQGVALGAEVFSLSRGSCRMVFQILQRNFGLPGSSCKASS